MGRYFGNCEQGGSDYLIGWLQQIQPRLQIWNLPLPSAFLGCHDYWEQHIPGCMPLPPNSQIEENKISPLSNFLISLSWSCYDMYPSRLLHLYVLTRRMHHKLNKSWYRFFFSYFTLSHRIVPVGNPYKDKRIKFVQLQKGMFRGNWKNNILDTRTKISFIGWHSSTYEDKLLGYHLCKK